MAYISVAQQVLSDFPRFLGANQFQVYLSLLYRSCKEMSPEITVSNWDLQRALDLSHVTIRKCLRELLQKGFIRIVRGHHKRTPNTYRIDRNIYDPAANRPDWNAFSDVKRTDPQQLLSELKEDEFKKWQKNLQGTEANLVITTARQQGLPLDQRMFREYFNQFVWTKIVTQL